MDDRESFLLCLCVFGCLWNYAVAQTPPEVLSAPEPQLVPFNLDTLVDFNCSVRGTQLIWQINTVQLVTANNIMDAQNIGIFPEVMDNGDGTLFGRVQINISESNMANMTRNMTQIVCIAVGSSTLIRSESNSVNLLTFAIPEPPRNFQLTPSTISNTLTIRWDPPTNTPPDVETTHDVEVVNLNTDESYPSFPRRGLMLDTTLLTFDDSQITSCAPFQFRVSATNDAGTSEPSLINETIPISPDVTPINDFLSTQNGIFVSFSGNEASITLMFGRAVSCSANFPVVDHIINAEIPESVITVLTNEITDTITVTLGPPASTIMADTVYTISVTAATAITSRASDVFQVYTTDVQTARVNYTESDNRVFLTCTFATGSTARGCIFIFTLRGESEQFFVTREDGVLCNSSINSALAYDTIQVVDWESDGSEGTLPRTIQPRLEDEATFSNNCPLPEVDSGLSGGAIAGIVIGVFVAVVIVAVIIILVLVFCFTKWRKKIPLPDSIITDEATEETPMIAADFSQPLETLPPSGGAPPPGGTDEPDGSSDPSAPRATPPTSAALLPPEGVQEMRIGKLDLQNRQIRVDPRCMKKICANRKDDKKPLILYCK